MLALATVAGMSRVHAVTVERGRTGRTIYVSRLGNDSDGSSWTNAFRTIQAGLQAVPDDKGGHRVIVRPDTYLEANLAPAFRGASGAYNVLTGDYDGNLGSGAKGWVIIDSSDPARGFKSWDWWGTFAASDKNWPHGNNSRTFSSIVCDRWMFRNLYVTGGDAGLFWDLTDQSGHGFTVICEDCVGIGRAFGAGFGYPTVREHEPSVFRRCYLMALDWDRDTAAVLLGGWEKSMPSSPHAVFEDCTMVHPDNAVGLSYASYCARARFKNCRMIALNFTQPEMGGKSTGIICTQGHQPGGRLHVDLEDCTLAGYSVFTPGKEAEAVECTTRGKVRAYVQFKQPDTKGFERIGCWPTELFARIAPPRGPEDLKIGAVSAAPASAEGRAVTASAPVIAAHRPELTRLPFAWRHAMENTPVIYKGAPMMVMNYRDDTKNKTEGYARSMYLYVQDLRTGEEVARFGEGHSFANAFVNGDELNVFASEGTNHDWFKSIYRFSTTDLKTWKREPAIALEGSEHLFNASVCRDDQGFLMAFESNLPNQWSFRFARSKDLSKWERVSGLLFTDPKNMYACPVLRYIRPYYYVIYNRAAKLKSGQDGWVPHMARSTDLASWELSPYNPILEPVAGEGPNNSDVDLFELEGNTYVFYATGDQATWASLRAAMYSGPMTDFFAGYFPANAPLMRIDIRSQ